MNTDEIRSEILTQRAGMHANLNADFSQKISETVINLEPFANAKHIAVYLTHRHEVNTEKIIEAIWQDGKQCYLPVLAPDTPNSLHFVRYEKDTPLQANVFNIMEPAWDVERCLPAEQLSLVIAPLVAFDAQCHRIGMGAGYYDRTFAFLNASPRPLHPRLIGIAFELQKLNSIHPEPWDVSLDAVVTESDIYLRSFA
jgi:5-formyltetrahydrofolate cyclo-ligase